MRWGEYMEHKDHKKDDMKHTAIMVLVGITMVLALINLIATLNLATKLEGAAPAAPAAPTAPSAPTAPTVVQASADDDPVKGDKNAKVTIIEFSDFQCPFCGRFYSQTLPEIEDTYVKTGKVKLVYRDFPLSFHQNAQKSSEAAECADDQGKFWEYHDKLFENQAALDDASLKQYAKDLGLNTATFNSCLDSGKNAAEVQKDFADGQKYGVSGTPSFFVNGQRIVGAQPFASFKTLIDAELAK